MHHEAYTEPKQVVRLWYHECHRVFGDRLTSTDETTRFTKMLVDCTKKNFEENSDEEVLRDLNTMVFTSFSGEQTSEGEPSYVEVRSLGALRRNVQSHLKDYNDSNPVMNLILFDQALAHVTRICRILRQPRGRWWMLIF